MSLYFIYLTNKSLDEANQIKNNSIKVIEQCEKIIENQNYSNDEYLGCEEFLETIDIENSNNFYVILTDIILDSMNVLGLCMILLIDGFAIIWINKVFFKKIIWWYIILILISIIYYVCLYVNNIEISTAHYKNILGIFYNIDDFKNNNIFILMYQIFLTIYTFICFFEYEKHNSPEFVFSRINIKSWLKQKLLIALISIMFLRTLYFFIVYFLLFPNIAFTFGDYILSIFYHIGIIIIIYFYKYSLIKIKDRC